MADTLTIARNLSAAGIARTQAEAIANAIGEWHGEVATKDFVRSEISALRGDMNAEISALRGDMNAEISALRGDMNAEISAVRSEISALRGDMNAETISLRGDMSAMETRLVRWIVGTGIALVGIMSAAMFAALQSIT